MLKVMLFCVDGDVSNGDKAAIGERMVVSVRILKMQIVLRFMMMNGMKRLMVLMKIITR